VIVENYDPDPLDELRLMVYQFAQQIRQPLSTVALHLAIMSDNGVLPLEPETHEEVALRLRKLAAQYYQDEQALRSRTAMWTDGDSLSCLWLCRSCGSELYAPLVSKRCLICGELMQEATTGSYGEVDTADCISLESAQTHDDD
jgi:rubrerythrin